MNRITTFKLFLIAVFLVEAPAFSQPEKDSSPDSNGDKRTKDLLQGN